MNVNAQPRVVLDGISRTFNREVLKEVSFAVEAGEFVSIIGPSGCGKSTLFNIIAGLDKPSSGEVSTDGEVAYMPQKDVLFPWRSIAANAALGLEVQGVARNKARAQVLKWFPRFGLAGFEDALPFELSGGMRQRAALLRTVVQNRSTLLLDEPFGALDALTKQGLHTWLQHVWVENNWTALMITHDVREALMLSDRVVVLSPRPATVSLILDVDLPKPRGIDALTSPRFLELERTLLETLGS